MVRIELVRGFEKYGINFLTGEACSYSNRLLCDVSDEGKALLETYFSVSIMFPTNWNSEVNGKPATGSIMLPRGDWLREFGLFILWHVEKCDYAHYEGGTLHGWSEGDEHCEAYLKLYGDMIWRNPNFGHPQVNGRNVHAFSGRVT